MDRFRAAKEAGFDAVEVLYPYDCPTQDMRDQLVWNDLKFVLMNCPPPNATGGAQGFAAVPALKDRFRRDFDRAMRFAGVLKPNVLHIMSGLAEGPEARATLIDNLKWATARAPKAQLTIEPINPHDMPGANHHQTGSWSELVRRNLLLHRTYKSCLPGARDIRWIVPVFLHRRDGEQRINLYLISRLPNVAINMNRQRDFSLRRWLL